MTDFASILSKPAEAVERPKPLPVGTYIGMVKGVPTFTNVGKENTPVADFQIAIMSPQDDVDREALAAYGDYAGKTQRLRFFLTDAAMFRLKEFLEEHLGIESAGRTMGEMLNDAPGHQVYVTIKQRPSQDGAQIYGEIDRTAKV